MGPSLVDTEEDLRNIQQSLWEVSPAGIDLFIFFITHGWLKRKLGQYDTDRREVIWLAIRVSLRATISHACLSKSELYFNFFIDDSFKSIKSIHLRGLKQSLFGFGFDKSLV